MVGYLFVVTAAVVAVVSSVTEPDCEWRRVLSADEEPQVSVLLQCRLRTITAADSVLANLTSAQLDMITSLKLECSDVFFFESSLESNSLITQLRSLRQLELEFCKIRYVPPAVLSASRDLRILSLRTHNTDWSAMTMELHADSFRGLPQLKTLDLSENNIWTVPNELFCPLYTLGQLNLSRNRLQDVSELGFSDWGAGPTAPGKTCNVGLEELDLSRNELTTVPDNAFTSLRSLQKLLLQENAIVQLADRAFVGLVSLQLLNASSNRLVALPPELFQSSRDLKEIYINNNSISVLAPGLLEGLDQLLQLDLSYNELTSSWVNRDTFSGLVRLVVLNLGHNRITRVDSHLFQDLYSLQMLNLEYNNIDSISEGSFNTLNNLHALTLSHNKLIKIESNQFSGLYVLNQLFLDHNRVEDVAQRAFENCSNLHDLGLGGNLLTSVPDAVRQLTFLKTLDLGENKIKQVYNYTFQGLDQLYGLRLIENELVNISKDSFSSLISLQVLNLAGNKIEHVDKSAFGTSPTLHAVRLDGNRLKDMSGMFVGLPGLVWLNVSDNQLQWFDYALVPQSLEWLDMHKNNVADLGNYFEKRDDLRIKTLDASFNRLTEVGDSSIPDSVETVLLNDNLIRKVKPNTFLRKSNLTNVALYNNRLEKIEVGALSLNPVPEDRELPQFYIGNNPIFCDCSLEWLQRINQMSHLRRHPRVMDLDNLVCKLAHSRGSPTRPLLDLRPSQFLCPYETHCFALCHCCDFDACDCEMTCPDNCTCYHDHTWTANVVDCSNAGYLAVPTKIPMDATEIYLDGNDLGELGSHVFIGKKKLQVLYLNNSNVQSLHNRTFNGLSSLKILHMENNKLKELRGFELDQLENVIELYLDHNEIRQLGNGTFSSMKGLQVLKLEENNILDFSPWQQLSSENLATISLEGNSWSCRCDEVDRLEAWLRDNADTLDQSKLLCSGSDGNTVMDTVRSCRQGRAAVSAVHRDSLTPTILGSDYVPFLAASLVVFIIIFLITTLAFIFRQDLSLWAHAKYGIRMLGDPGDTQDDRLYDAYMVYSLKDEEFVTQVLATGLERSGYTLCLHYRDLQVVSPAYLRDSVLGASEAARRVILVLSLSFLQHEWERPQFRAALQACADRARDGKLLLLLLTSDPSRDADLQLQLLFKASRRVIFWGEKRFWEKLRYALPDPRIRPPSKACCEGGKQARYSATPTVEAWCRMSPASLSLAQSAPTQSSCVSEESSQRTTDEEDDPHSYVSIDCHQRHHQHLYTTIPDPNYGTHQGRTYFV
ncbi:toll-like receptor Tollo [Lycorma delicatula]|uniref:toll-like receptor Tollo n=1 Tax=Lycorma delicatula TaxID=130591 RepID=UPI003F5118B1